MGQNSIGVPCFYDCGNFVGCGCIALPNFEENLVVKIASYRNYAFVAMMGMATYMADLFSPKVLLPSYTYLGLVYLFLVFISLKVWVAKAEGLENKNKWVRRTMISSMLRMFLALVFLVITFVNEGKADIPFTVLYCVYFILFLLFEISEKRINLRPDSSEQSNS